MEGLLSTGPTPSSFVVSCIFVDILHSKFGKWSALIWRLQSPTSIAVLELSDGYKSDKPRAYEWQIVQKWLPVGTNGERSHNRVPAWRIIFSHRDVRTDYFSLEIGSKLASIAHLSLDHWSPEASDHKALGCSCSYLAKSPKCVSHHMRRELS